MNWISNLYWGTPLWRVHCWCIHRLGAVTCWLRGYHVEVTVFDSMVAAEGRPPVVCEGGVYCCRCGIVFSGDRFPDGG